MLSWQKVYTYMKQGRRGSNPTINFGWLPQAIPIPPFAKLRFKKSNGSILEID